MYYEPGGPPPDNTSGLGGQWPVPNEVEGLNWGAFFLPVFWALGNRSLGSALLCFVPGIAMVMRFVLLFDGNARAWKNKHWESVARFKSSQRTWAIVGVLFYPVLILFVCVIGSIAQRFN